jgi:4-(gamma-glutamylamino)butanal dehydrogenase
MREQSIDWLGKQKGLTIDGRALIAGNRVPAARGETIPVISPRDGASLTEVSACDELDIHDAVTKARTAQQAGVWCKESPKYRRQVLIKWAEKIESAGEELALLVSLEMGKPIRAALNVEVRSILQSVRWYAEIADKLQGRHPDVGPNAVALVEREAAGLVGIVLPWNFPLSMVGYDVAPALMLGNAVLVKPSELAPLSVLRCCELAIEAGVPPSVLSVLPGYGIPAGAALGRHDDVDVIAITGTQNTGRAFLQYSAESNCKRVWPKLGGKSTIIICGDARSLDAACQAVAWAAYFNQGAMCTGGSRIFVEQSILERTINKLKALTEGLKVGDPLLWETDLGPLASMSLVQRAGEVVHDALEKGASVLCGRQSVHDNGSQYFPPTLLSGLPRASRLYCEEVFAPIAGIEPFNDFRSALKDATPSGLGMAISIWTSSLQKAFEASRSTKVGTCWVNCFEGDDLSVPFGGVKKSGYGKDKAQESLEKYSDLKTTWIQLDESTYW